MTDTAGNKLKFGTEGLKGNTPKALKIVYRVIGALFGAWLSIQPMFPEITEHQALLVTRIFGATSVLLYAVSQMFGWTKPE